MLEINSIKRINGINRQYERFKQNDNVYHISMFVGCSKVLLYKTKMIKNNYIEGFHIFLDMFFVAISAPI